MTPDEFAERFKRLRSSEDRYRYLIQLGRKLEPYPEDSGIKSTWFQDV